MSVKIPQRAFPGTTSLAAPLAEQDIRCFRWFSDASETTDLADRQAPLLLCSDIDRGIQGQLLPSLSPLGKRCATRLGLQQ